MVETTSKRQQEIIESAGKLLIEKGIKGLTTKNLAQEMGFSESALYRHFKNKEDIIVLLLNYLFFNIKERLEIIQSKDVSAEEKLHLIFKSQFSYFSQNPHFIIAILSEGLFDETEKIYQAMLKIINYKMQVISGIIEDGKRNNEINPFIQTTEIVHIIMGSFRLMMLKWKLSKFEINLAVEGNKIMQTNIKLFMQ
ncbi:MAG: TetR/AcrR family transcriptional regulator [Flavobacterium sp.]|nr:TetR/AcrR family transcriptional regulator [Flavobacterium sp.]